MGTAFERLTARLAEVTGRQPSRAGDWPCPSHDDGTPSLSVSNGGDRVLVHCQAGCHTDDVVAALGLTKADLFDEPKKRGGFNIVDVYRYVDEDSVLMFEVCRLEPKSFRQRRPNGSGGWEWRLGDTRRVLYRLPKVLDAAKAGATVFVVEGERDVHSLEAAGVTATTGPAGAGKWRPEYAEALRGAGAVVVVADKDAAGYRHAEAVEASVKALGIPVTVVQALEGKDASDHLAAGHGVDELVPVAAPDAEAALADIAAVSAPAGSSVAEAGWNLLDAVAAFLARYVVFPSVAARDAVALWVVHSHAIGCAETTPHLSVQSPLPRCGKTRLLEVLELVCLRPLSSVSCSTSVLFRSVDAEERTVLLDEIDAIFGPKAPDNEDLRALVNCSHRRGAEVQRMVGLGTNMAPRSFKVFSAMVLAGIGEPPRTIADRAIVVRMRRRAPGEAVTRFRRRDVLPTAGALRDRVAAWVAQHRDELTAARPELPAELDDRAADGWEPLLAIADAAGGKWPEQARAAALELSAGTAPEDDSAGVRLLADVRSVFADAERLASAELAERLAGLEEAPWAVWKKGPPPSPLDARGLARMLRAYDISPKQVRLGERNLRGYERSDFVDAWDRYCPSAAPPPDPPEPPERQHPLSEPLQPLHRRSEAISEVLQPPTQLHLESGSDLRCSGVAGKSACFGCGTVTDDRDPCGDPWCSTCESESVAQ